MSWSVSVTGTRETAKEEIAAQFDRAYESYKEKPEGADILAAKGRALALIDGMDLTPDTYGTQWNAVKVTAHGSHGWSEKGLTTASFTVSVERTHLAI